MVLFGLHRLTVACRPRAILGFSLALASLVAAAARAQQPLPKTDSEYIHHLEDPQRGEWQKPAEVIAKLGLKPGDQVADLGAGSGYFTFLLARAVGPQGKVYAVDIEGEMLDYIRQRAQNDNVKNIQLVKASPHDPKLAPASVDMIFICDTLHHIPERPTYYPLLARALRPRGRLVNIDFYKKPLPLGPPLEMKIDKPAMIEEAKSAGFHVIQDYDFLPYQYFLIFQQ
ncbi:MAG TPA: methyltransferase domain-containing protein [Terriglobia bacterium]|nr:methyltransferase domain-containing protein [Terriglobia bacterium]